MARMRALSLLTLAALVLLAGCNRSGGQGWSKFTDPAAAYAITYPAHWQVDSSPLPRASFAASGTGADKGLSCSLYHERHPALAGVATQAALASVSEDLIRATLSGSFKGVALSERPGASLSNLPARHFTVTYQVRGGLGGATQPYMGDVLVTVANGGYYNFFCGGPVERYVAEGERLEAVRRSVAVFPAAG